MGCATSKSPKQRRACQHCNCDEINQNQVSRPVSRSYSMHVHHPPQSQNDTYHLVALTSSTLGSLQHLNHINKDELENHNNNEIKDLAVAVVEARTWSAMIDRKIPKIVPRTPIRTPPGEPETINAWELMEGLDDVSPFRSPIHNNHDPNRNQVHHFRSFSFDVAPTMKLPVSPPRKRKERVVLYFTSLRGVRKTYEDCCHVRSALKGFGVRVDERDVSMHSGFRDELRRVSGGGGLCLPRVFVGEKCVGGAEEIRKLIEDGSLEKLLENCERMKISGDGCDAGEFGSGGVCEACGDVRFVPCETCSGSCKVYCEEEEEEKEESSEEDYGFQRCPDCNENGLVRCPICCY